MPESSPERLSLAVLIDAENASAKIAAGLFEKIALIGDANVRRIYGDFSKQNHKAWTEVLARHAISARQNFPYSVGKNSTDIELVIDAMDLLHGGRVDGFCLVSSDGDFTGLAKRIREQGLMVFGFGEQEKTPESFIQACHEFTYTKTLAVHPPPASESTTSAPPPETDIQSILKNAVSQAEKETGWMHLSELGNVIRRIRPDFAASTYNHRNLSELIKSTDLFDIEQPNGGGSRVRIKRTAPTPKKK